ncbi:MAG: hypothetical protein GWN84_20655 [Gammaproteobacteria bacterium]|nr:hypothetical protein [Gammaproteobacteria bacterium]NIR85173.1 hypothetical protein [Gammaproteobacteria bacterium]NIU06222.1 hypothetical protein [Gammaproteobacteria bacterium]NIX87495.1 hypothetical protein [Gammaproteobacteria bacterium]
MTLRYPDRQVGSQLPAFPIRLRDAGAPVDLTAQGASLQFRMVQAAGDELVKVNDAAATAADANGNGEYLPAAAEVDTPGDFECQWIYTDPAGNVYRTPIIAQRIVANP